ncbi:hypothetical protein LTR28_001222 [Elasticomyces elasticus]|nr:hypothetical protein LTR28_001222 [Elasticomyces elasticus]
MAKTPPDERLVYLALRNIFKGADAQVRNPKKIRERIQKHQHYEDVRDLVQEHNLDNVCNAAKVLLEEQIFQSTLKAKVRFPEVFEVSPAQSAERTASEAEAAKTEDDAIKGAAEGRHEVVEADLTMEDVLQKEEWDCPESVELKIWSKIFLADQDKFAADKVDELGKPFDQSLDSIAKLRHTAVHRIRVSVNMIEQFTVDSESLARLLQDDTCATTLSRLRRETQLTIDELKRNKDLLESRLAEKLRKIAAQRAELNHLEHAAVEDMLKEDREYQTLAGANLEQAIISPETIVQSVATTENETSSEADVDADSFVERDIGHIGEKASWSEAAM